MLPGIATEAAESLGACYLKLIVNSGKALKLLQRIVREKISILTPIMGIGELYGRQHLPIFDNRGKSKIESLD